MKLLIIFLISFSVNAQSLIGSGANQVPTNGHLGTMAFEDAKNYMLPVSVVAREAFQNNLAADTESQLYFTSVTHSSHLGALSANTEFIAPYDGTYSVKIRYATASKAMSSGDAIYTIVKLNGSILTSSFDNVVSTSVIPHQASFNEDIKMKKGEVLTFFSVCPESTLTNTDARYSSLSIHRVSP